jgi:hypothetical protein
MTKRLVSLIPLLIVILTVLFIYGEFIPIDGLILHHNNRLCDVCPSANIFLAQKS